MAQPRDVAYLGVDLRVGHERHLNAFASGDNVASDSGVYHLGHLAASCAILLDAIAAGRLNDDRPEDVCLEAYLLVAAELIAT